MSHCSTAGYTASPSQPPPHGCAWASEGGRVAQLGKSNWGHLWPQVMRHPHRCTWENNLILACSLQFHRGLVKISGHVRKSEKRWILYSQLRFHRYDCVGVLIKKKERSIVQHALKKMWTIIYIQIQIYRYLCTLPLAAFEREVGETRNRLFM